MQKKRKSKMKDQIKKIFNETEEMLDNSPAVIASKHYAVQGLLTFMAVSLRCFGVPILALGKLLELIDIKVTKKIYDRRQYWLDGRKKKKGQALENTAMKVDTGSLEVPAVDIEGKGYSDPKAEEPQEDEERSTLSPVSYEDETLVETFGSLMEKEPKIIDDQPKGLEGAEPSSTHQSAMRAPNRKRVGNQRKNRTHSH